MSEATQALAALLEQHKADPDAVNVVVDLGRLRAIAAEVGAVDVATESAVAETESDVEVADVADA